MAGERAGNQGHVAGTEHLSDTAQAMMSQIALGTVADDTGTAPANAGSDSTSTEADDQDAEGLSAPEDGDTVSEEGDDADSDVPEDLSKLQTQYAAEVTRLMGTYQRVTQERDQAQTDHKNAVAFGTRKSQEAADALRTVDSLNQRLAALEQRLANTTQQAGADAEALGYDAEALSDLGLTPQALRGLLIQMPEFQQLYGAVVQMQAQEQRREYDTQISTKTQALLNKVDGWSKALYRVPTSQLSDQHARQVLATALQMHGTGQIEDAENLIREEYGRVIVSRIASRQAKGQTAGLKAVSESARGSSPKGGKPHSAKSGEFDLGEDFARLSAPEASARLQTTMLRAIDTLPRK